jgi:microcystin-dependent protein
VVISLYVSDTQLAIISKDEFTPKATLAGFVKIRKGINLIDTNIDGVTTTDYRLIGTETNSAKLGGVDAANFVRKDINQTVDGSLSIRNNAGVIIGSDLSASLTNTSTGATILYNKTEGSSIFIRTNKDGSAQDVITASGSNVGINKTNPVYELDVDGTIRTSNNLFVSGTTNAVDLNTGSMRTAGGLSVAKSLQVGQGITVVGTTNSNSVIPTTTNTYDLGSSNYAFRNLYVNNIDAVTVSGSFSGQLVGSVNGSATKLASATKFRIEGDVLTNEISFNGVQQNGEAVFTATITPDFISSKTLVNVASTDDQLIIQRPTEGLRKVTVAGLLERAGVVPIGTILPFAGSTVPNGFLLCDGSEVLVSEYTELWKVIQYSFKAFSTLVGTNTFGLPDLRGRFPLGADNMFQEKKVPIPPTNEYGYTVASRAYRVNNTSAIQVGLGSGTEDTSLAVDQLPDHQHDMKAKTAAGTKGQQYYATRNSSDKGGDVNIVDHTTKGPTALGEGQFLPNSGGVDSPVLGNAVPLMNPYLTINYIIFTGKFI